MAYIGKTPSSGIRNRFIYTATAGQTTFSGTDDHSRTLSYTDAEFTDVFLNGVKLDKSDYTATSGTSIVLDEGAAVDDILEVLAFDTFSVFSGEFSQDVTVGGATTMTGDLTVDTDTLHVDSTNNRVGVGTTSPNVSLHLQNSTSADDDARVRLTSGTSGEASILLGDTGYGSRGRIVYDNADDTLQFWGADSTTSAQRVTIDSSGNVGIGTTSPTAPLMVNGGVTNFPIVVNSTDQYAGIAFADNTTTSNAHVAVYADGNELCFEANNAERVRITTNQMRLNPTEINQEGGYLAWADDSSQDQTYIYARNNADTSPVFQAEVGNVLRAEIESDGSFHSSANSYSGFSDQNYKENITLSGSQWDDIKAIQVKKYSWIHDNLSSPNQLGVIAQDLEASGMSGLVTNHTRKKFDADGNEVDLLDDDGNPITYKSVKYSVLYMKAIKALQEAMTKIETLETKVAALEASD